MKFILLIVLAAVACRVLWKRWPWELIAPSPRARDETRARMLLDVAPAATRTEIIEAHRRLIARVHPDRGGSDAAVHEANAARDVLLATAPPDRRS